MSERFEKEAPGQAFGGSPLDYKNRAYTFLDVLCNDRDFPRAHSYLDPNCVLIHADNPPVRGADEFISGWQQNLKQMPDYHKNILDIVVEPGDEHPGVAKVWVYSQISGITKDKLTDSIDMMHFSASGLFLDSKDVQRTVGRPDAAG